MPRMIPMKTSSIFKSRWMAESTPQATNSSDNADQATDVTGAPITPANEKQFENALNSI